MLLNVLKKKRIGTPKTIDQAIENSAESTSYLLSNPEDVETMKSHIKDYLSQHFTKYMMSESENVPQAMHALWFDLFGEKR